METLAKKKGYHHGDLASALVEATLELVWELGPRGFSMSQACRSAGVSATAVYRHFESKEALLAEVARRGFVEFQQRLLGAVEGQNGPLERLSALGCAYVRFATEHPAQFEVMFMAAIDKHVFPDTECEGLKCLQVLIDEVHRAVEAGHLPPAREAIAVQMLWSQVHGLAVLQLETLRSQATSPIEWDYPACVRTACQQLLKS